MQPSKKVGNHIVSSLLLYDEAKKNSAFIILCHRCFSLLFVIGISRFKFPEELQKTSQLWVVNISSLQNKIIFYGDKVFRTVPAFGDLTKMTWCRTEFTCICLYKKRQTHILRISVIRYSTIHSHNSAVDEWQLCSCFFVFSFSFPKVSVFLLADNWQKRGFVNTNKTFFQKI